MTSSLLQFFGSAVVIIFAGAALTRFADAISSHTKLGRLFVGSILLAGATSLPELATDISAVRLGSLDLAVGDLMGSCLFNLLILAILDLTRYSHGRMLSREAAAHALAAGTTVGLVGLAAIFILLEPKLHLPTIANLGPGSLMLVVAYVFGVRLVYVSRQSTVKPARSNEAPVRVPILGELTRSKAIAGYLVSAAVILGAAPFLARAADDLANRTGLGGTFFGTTAVALCTSLPELVTTFTAVRMQAFDLALGNIFGSNAFNMVLLAPLDAVHPGSLLAEVSPIHVYTGLCIIVVTTVAVLGQLYQVERKKPFLEPDALLTIALIVAALTGLFFVRKVF